MRLLPYDTWTMEVALSPESVIAALTLQTFQGSPMERDEARPPFRGKLENRSFEFIRRHQWTRGRNSFKPQLLGRLSETSGTKIFIRAMPHRVVSGFMIFWLVALLGISAKQISDLGLSADRIFVPLLMAVGGYALTMFGFWAEIPETRQLLNEVVARKVKEA